ncbi:hypothetical protein GCM10010123_06960 [Pilimelia anulata]|uniref:AAA+ ATPase domain-containing protein n=1 Tax=Pilimelia anulata TaxID=53371 RepID=A0A8J3F6E9_9ACTN|nr:NB-ARC domain-containing protein [Pilimelia anulata]GGJ79775.1 hypothetical protein GCM10010123_06960 [Pilimelia anulata]
MAERRTGGPAGSDSPTTDVGGPWYPVRPPRGGEPLARATDVAPIVAALTGPGPDRHVALCGPGGVGKTVLARAAADRAVRAGHFPGGAIMADLRGDSPTDPVTPAALLRGLLAAAGAPDRPIPGHPAGEYDRLHRLLADRPATLLLFDNALDWTQISALAPGPDTPHRVLVTARDKLTPPGFATRRLGPLPPAAAADLLRGLLAAGDPRPAAEPAALRALAARCAGLPLAIALVARTLRQHPEPRIADLPRPAADPVAADPVAAAVRLALACLDERRPGYAGLFPLLALHPGRTFGAAATADLLGPTAPADLAAELCRAGLIEPDGVRWHLLDPVARYARELLDGVDPAVRRAARDRLHTRYADRARAEAARAGHLLLRHTRPPGWAEAATPAGHAAALRWFRRARTALLGCARRLPAGPAAPDPVEWPPASAAVLVDLIESLAGFLRHDGPWATAVELYRRAADAAADPLARGTALHHRGTVLRLQGQLPAAFIALTAAERAFRSMPRGPVRTRGLANVLYERGLAYLDAGDHARAAAALGRALRRYLAVGDGPGTAHAHAGLGAVRSRAEPPDVSAAREHLAAALAGYTALGDASGAAAAHSQLSELRRAGPRSATPAALA